MKPLEYITQEKHRVTTRLAKLMPEVAGLNAELAKLESAEEVFTKATGAVVDTGTPEPARRGRRPGSTNKPKDTSKPNLSDTILTVLRGMPAGGDKEEITAALRGFGLEAKGQYLTIALQRHVKADRLILNDGRWYTPVEEKVSDDNNDAGELYDQAAE